MSLVGIATLWASFLAMVCAAVLFGLSAFARGDRAAAAHKGRVAMACTAVSFAAVTIACLIIVYCFFSGDNSLSYVVQYRSKSTSDLLWFYTLSGLWAGRQGSLLFWAWLISAFALFVAMRRRRNFDKLDGAAMAIVGFVLALFLGLLLFSDANTPFAASSDTLVNSDGSLTTVGSLYGMNPLLEHWAMAIHPPTLFIGYAGLTLPFAYAFAAILICDDSCEWILRICGVARFSWLFLGIGIGLGSIWAYVVLGWGGYWGWDPVENASLLSWIACTALIHSMTVARRYGVYKRWAISTACFSFMFVIVGTFISRSGLVQSVHAFTGDSVSLAFFVVLIAATFAAGLFGAFGRPRSFAVKDPDEEEGGYASREMGYFLLNVIMMVLAFVLAYLTLSSALPSWLPFGGTSVETSTYDSLARPLSIVLMAIIAICPLLGWKHTSRAGFAKNARVPAVCAAALFALILVFFFTSLLPAYDATASGGDSFATELAEYGPSWYYNGLAIVGFAVACLLIFNSLFMLVRMAGAIGKGRAVGAKGSFRRSASTFGGLLAHMAMGIILIGLIGSSMYVTEKTGYVASSDTSEASTSLQIQNYTIEPRGEQSWQEGSYTYFYQLDLDVYRDGEYLCTVTPSIEAQALTQQQKLNAAVVSLPTHDLFVVYRGVNDSDDYSLDVRINPLVNLVWLGFVLLMAGTAIALFSKRQADGPAAGGDECADATSDAGAAPAADAAIAAGEATAASTSSTAGEVPTASATSDATSPANSGSDAS